MKKFKECIDNTGFEDLLTKNKSYTIKILDNGLVKVLISDQVRSIIVSQDRFN
jgi:hypothetical protein